MIKTIYNIAMPLLLVASLIFSVEQCNRTKSYKEESTKNKEIINAANKIVSITIDKDSNYITKSIPQQSLLSKTALETKGLLDTVNSIKIPKNERIVSYNKVPISSSFTGKATKVTDEFAETENDNWYLSYSFKDSMFNGTYKTVYTSVVTEKKPAVLSFNKDPEKLQYDWVLDKGADPIKPISILSPKIKDSKYGFKLNNVNKFRSLDNTLLTGAEAAVSINRFEIGGQYLYNLYSQKTEWEATIKYKIIK